MTYPMCSRIVICTYMNRMYAGFMVKGKHIPYMEDMIVDDMDVLSIDLKR